jgi:hypothetical protein
VETGRVAILENCGKLLLLLSNPKCGVRPTGGLPAPSDPKFPKLEDYEFKFIESQGRWGTEYYCLALPKTDMARRVDVMGQPGRTQEEAKQMVIERYKEMAKPWR